MARTEIRVTGFGGQGVVLSGHIIGRAYAVEAGKHSTMIQSFGPEARGSACSATLVVSDEEILYPYVRRLDIFVAMSGEGYWKHKDELVGGGILIHERDLVKPEHGEHSEGLKVYSIPSTRIAEEIGRKIVQNIVMLGFVAAATQLVTREQMRDAVLGSVPTGTEELNLRAFDAGYDFFEKEYGPTGGSSETREEALAGTGK